MLSRRTVLTGAAALAVVVAGPAAGIALAGTRWDRLHDRLAGRLVLPEDAGYPAARQMAAAQFDGIAPAAVAYCTSAEDVRSCLLFARDEQLDFAVRSGGHGFTGWSTGTGLVIDVSGMDAVTAAGGTARIGPGADAVHATAALRPYGLTVPSGLCPTVALGGFVTGGGLGWQTRLVGPASDRLRAAEVVLADGRIVRCSEREEPDLFWALRGGGGGNFGIVTAFELATAPLTPVTTFKLSWPGARAAAVIPAWQRWIEEQPAELTSGMGVLLKDAAPDAAAVTVVSGAHFGTPEQASAAVDALVAAVGSPPVARQLVGAPYDAALMSLFGCADKSVDQCDLVGHNPEATLPREQYIHHRSRMFSGPWPESGVAAALAAYESERRAGQYRWLGFLSLGANANRVASDATAYVHRDASFFSLYSVGLRTPVPDPGELAAATAWIDRGFAAFDGFSTGRTYVNYPDESIADWPTAYYGENYARLTRVKRQYDPDSAFRFPQAVRPA